MYLIVIYIVLYFTWFIAAGWNIVTLQNFVAAAGGSMDEQKLDQYKILARQNMYVVLFLLITMLPAILMSAYVAYRFGMLGLFLVLALNAVLFIMSKRSGDLEKQARGLPCADPAVQEEYETVTYKWQKKMLPDF